MEDVQLDTGLDDGKATENSCVISADELTIRYGRLQSILGIDLLVISTKLETQIARTGASC